MNQTLFQLEAEKSFHKVTYDNVINETLYAKEKGEITKEECEATISQVKFDFEVVMGKIQAEEKLLYK